MSSLISAFPEQTKQIAADFALTLKGGEVIFLQGDLGAGKTTFVQGLVSAFLNHSDVRSPTFTIINIYPVVHDRIRRIVHVDLYRLKNISELQALALEEFMDDKTVVLIEWPELLELGFNKPYHKIAFEESSDGRIITL